MAWQEAIGPVVVERQGPGWGEETKTWVDLDQAEVEAIRAAPASGSIAVRLWHDGKEVASFPIEALKAGTPVSVTLTADSAGDVSVPVRYSVHIPQAVVSEAMPPDSCGLTRYATSYAAECVAIGPPPNRQDERRARSKAALAECRAHVEMLSDEDLMRWAEHATERVDSGPGRPDWLGRKVARMVYAERAALRSRPLDIRDDFDNLPDAEPEGIVRRP